MVHRSAFEWSCCRSHAWLRLVIHEKLPSPWELRIPTVVHVSCSDIFANCGGVAGRHILSDLIGDFLDDLVLVRLRRSRPLARAMIHTSVYVLASARLIRAHCLGEDHRRGNHRRGLRQRIHDLGHRRTCRWLAVGWLGLRAEGREVLLLVELRATRILIHDSLHSLVRFHWFNTAAATVRLPPKQRKCQKISKIQIQILKL